MKRKKLIVLLLTLIGTTMMQAQDVIVKRDGSTILSKVLEVNQNNIKYKKFSNQSGPTYTIDKTEVMSINYEGGDKDTFDTASPQEIPSEVTTQKKSAGLVRRLADAHNAELIALHNKDHGVTKKIDTNNKKPWFAFNLFWVSPTSIMSNDEFEMDIVMMQGQRPTGTNGSVAPYRYHAIVLKNKTDNYIYVDLCNTFRTLSTGEVRCYFNSELTTVTQGSSSGGGIGVGGLVGATGLGATIGGASSHSVSTTYASKNVLSIPPHGQRNLTEEKWVETKKEKFFTSGEFKRIEEAELFGEIKTGFSRDQFTSGQFIYDEANSPFTIDYTIKYSTSQDFSSYSLLSAKLFLRSLVTQYNIGFPDKPEKYIEDIDQYTFIGSGYVLDDKKTDKILQKKK